MRDVTISVISPEGGVRHVSCRRGANLRQQLIRAKLSPHRGISCSGMGICGTCSVKVVENEPAIRRSCQIRCFRDLEIELLS